MSSWRIILKLSPAASGSRSCASGSLPMSSLPFQGFSRPRRACSVAAPRPRPPAGCSLLLLALAFLVRFQVRLERHVLAAVTLRWRPSNFRSTRGFRRGAFRLQKSGDISNLLAESRPVSSRRHISRPSMIRSGSPTLAIAAAGEHETRIRRGVVDFGRYPRRGSRAPWLDSGSGRRVSSLSREGTSTSGAEEAERHRKHRPRKHEYRDGVVLYCDRLLALEASPV